MSRPTTPTIPTSSTLLEIEERLKDLELKFLGPPSDVSAVSNPFQPVSAIRKRIEALAGTPSLISDKSTEKREPSSSKLPAVTLPTFDGSDLDYFLKQFERWMRLSGISESSDQYKIDWLIEASTPKVKKLVEKVAEETGGKLILVLQKLEILFPKLENDLTLGSLLDKIPQLGPSPDPASVAQLFVEFEEIFSRLSTNAMSDQDKFLCLCKKLHPKTFQELRGDRHYKHRTENYANLKLALI